MCRHSYGCRHDRESHSSRVRTPIELDLCYDDMCEGDTELEPNRCACGILRKARRRRSSEEPNNSTRPALHTRSRCKSQPVGFHNNYVDRSLQSLATFIG